VIAYFIFATTSKKTINSDTHFSYKLHAKKNQLNWTQYCQSNLTSIAWVPIMIADTRISILNKAPINNEQGRYVLYWMQQAQRVSFNHALDYAVRQANDAELPLLVGFGLMDDYPEANERHFAFMLEGLAEVANGLRERGIKFVIRRGSPDAMALELGKQAALIVMDVGYLRHQKAWRQSVAKKAACQVLQVESDVVVPVGVVSTKRESAARTIRPKLRKCWDEYLKALTQSDVKHASLDLEMDSEVDIAAPKDVLKTLNLDRSVAPVEHFKGGFNEAKKRLTRFLRGPFEGYHENRNNLSTQGSSMLSPYLHFGQISPIEVALKVKSAKSGTEEDSKAYLEELIIRRELAANFVNYEPAYDSYRCLPDWAQQTLAAHRDDSRQHRYTRRQLEKAETHDPYWNAAMNEMRLTGYMQGYMRMYWGKKILEWSNTPEYAYETTLYLNNKYFLDGRDANSFANVAWCFGLHDHAWQERAVFGKVRYMNANGLKRKFDVDAYVARVTQLSK
jgi:deoxyribodipyrimidine photo-lyase